MNIPSSFQQQQQPAPTTTATATMRIRKKTVNVFYCGRESSQSARRNQNSLNFLFGFSDMLASRNDHDASLSIDG